MRDRLPSLYFEKVEIATVASLFGHAILHQTGVADETHTQTKLESIFRERCEPMISVSLSSFLSSVHGLVIGVASLPSTDHGSGKLSVVLVGKDAQRCGRFGQS